MILSVLLEISLSMYCDKLSGVKDASVSLGLEAVMSVILTGSGCSVSFSSALS